MTAWFPCIILQMILFQRIWFVCIKTWITLWHAVQGIKIENLIHGAGRKKGIRPGTENIIEIVGLSKACELAQHNLQINQAHMYAMRERLIEGLLYRLNNKVTINTNLDNSLLNTLSIAFEGVEAHALETLLSNDVLISIGSACHSESIEISSVLKAMDIDQKLAESTVRISTGKLTTVDEIDYVIKAIANAVKKLN